MSRYFIAPGAFNEPTLWLHRYSGDHLALARKCELEPDVWDLLLASEDVDA